MEAVQRIAALEPNPGGARAVETHYVVPDVLVKKVGDDYAIILNEDGCRGSGSTHTTGASSGRGRGAALRRGPPAVRRLADQEHPAATEDPVQGHALHRPVPARVPRQGAPTPPAAVPPGRGRGHPHARVDGEPRDHSKFVETPQGTSRSSSSSTAGPDPDDLPDGDGFRDGGEEPPYPDGPAPAPPVPPPRRPGPVRGLERTYARGVPTGSRDSSRKGLHRSGLSPRGQGGFLHVIRKPFRRTPCPP